MREQEDLLLQLGVPKRVIDFFQKRATKEISKDVQASSRGNLGAPKPIKFSYVKSPKLEEITHKPTLSYGNAPKMEESKPKTFSFGQLPKMEQPTHSSPFSFGNPQKMEEPTPKTFSFGQIPKMEQPTHSSPFSFGNPQKMEEPAPKTFSFGQLPKMEQPIDTPFSFGNPQKMEETTPESTFRFGKPEEKKSTPKITLARKELLTQKPTFSSVRGPSLEITTNRIQKQFETGEIPIGFYDRLLWSTTVKALSTLPQIIEENRDRLQQLQEKESAAQQRLVQLQEENRALVDDIAAHQTDQRAIKHSLMLYEEILNSDFQSIAQQLCQPEEQVTTSIQTQFNEFTNFASLDGGEFEFTMPKLSLVFNSFGVTPSTIRKLRNVDGYDFFASEVSGLCDEFGIKSFYEIKQLAFIQNMAKSGVFWGGVHQEECPICHATTAKDLRFLIEEHAHSNEDVKQLNVNLLEQLGINGQAFLALNPQDTRKYLKINDSEKRKKFLKAVRYFENIHREHILV